MVHIDDRDGVRVIRMAHGKVSAMDVALCEALSGAIAGARADEVRAVVITGTGSSFSAGVDLFQVVTGGPDYVDRFLPLFETMLRDVLTLNIPVVAAVNGHAIAGGCVLACACDQRIMAEGPGRVGVPELAVGVPFPTLALGIMAARVPSSTLRRLVYTGRTVQMDEALASGLVDERSAPEHLLDRACDLARQLAAIPPATFALTKFVFAAPILEQTHRLADIDARVATTWREPGVYDAIRAYLEKTVGKTPKG